VAAARARQRGRRSPGSTCHLRTTSLERGPQEFTAVWGEGYRKRFRRIPRPEVFVELVDSADPADWDHPVEAPGRAFARDDDRDWNKIGGTPHWLQGEESPEAGWEFLAQFTADLLATERGDGAECYLWQHPDGRVAFGWQCH